MYRSLLVLVLVSVCSGDWGGSDLAGSFQSGMKSLEEATKALSDIFGSREAPREEIEEDKDQEDKDASIESLETHLKDIPSIFNIFVTSTSKPWWQGKNVCVTREVKTDNSSIEDSDVGRLFVFGVSHFSSCSQSPSKYICTDIIQRNGFKNTSVVTYQCCHGYRKIGKDCVKVDMKPLMEVISDMGALKFLAAIKSAGLESAIEQDNVTVFVPTDEAFDRRLSKAMYDGNKIDADLKIKKAIQNNEVRDMVDAQDAESAPSDVDFVMAHVVQAVVDSDDMGNDMVLKSMEDSTLRINVYPGRHGPSATVNCASFNTSERISTSGLLYSVDSVLDPVTKSVMDILDDPNYSLFKQMLEDNDLLNAFEGEGSFTLLLLNNDAVSKLSPVIRNSKCIKKILEHQILGHTVCSRAARSSPVSARDDNDGWLLFELKDDGLVFDREVKATKADILATNGVLHEVETLVVPSSAKLATDGLTDSNHTTFLALLEAAGLTDDLDSNPDLELFVPVEAALREAAAETEAMSKQELRELLMFHVGVVTRGEGGGEEGKSRSVPTMLNGSSLRVDFPNNILSGLMGGHPTVQCVQLLPARAQVCNGEMQLIDGLLRPPNSTLFEIVQSSNELNSFREILQGTKLEEELKQGLGRLVTLLLPTDEAFKKIGNGNYETLKKDKELADQLLRTHILTDHVCCSSVVGSSWPFVNALKTLSGSRMEAERGGRGRVSFGGARVKNCDLSAKDGLVHLLEAVIMPQRERFSSDIFFQKPHSEIILTGF